MSQSTISRLELLHTLLGTPLQDAEEETFLLFSQDIPSNNLGFVDAEAETIEVEIAGQDYTFQQSPGLLKSNSVGGTTGAVLWKVTPLLASWLSSFPSVLTDLHTLHTSSVIVELGCGLTGLIGRVLSRSVRRYVLTDQPLIVKHLKANLIDGALADTSTCTKSKKKSTTTKQDVLQAMPLDWENDAATNLKTSLPADAEIDLLILCDCVYNEYLVKPLVQTCVDTCMLGSGAGDRSLRGKQTVVLVAQQLRSDVIFELFLETMMEKFEMWRVPEERLAVNLAPTSGYAVHLAVMKNGRGASR
ncbi:hypothetical protein LTR84_002242 [Exophiala bonariae]|uniref:Diaminohydroxyphosphoribosylamino-pyrimidine deaminase n=1 Tax=Exophiala bonariae TaxID=1690606 RepID=A0AAV9NBR1_9EURO|nr:hypothetical protein LTR84_002242 [Exophiala bonariae]